MTDFARMMSIFNAALLLSPTLAPVAGGFLAETKGWRWIFWLMTILVCSPSQKLRLDY
jgi:MFS family permease